MASSSENIRWFETIGLDDISLVGGKNASLGELYCELGKLGARVPNGFALTTCPIFNANTGCLDPAIGKHCSLNGRFIPACRIVRKF